MIAGIRLLKKIILVNYNKLTFKSWEENAIKPAQNQYKKVTRLARYFSTDTHTDIYLIIFILKLF